MKNFKPILFIGALLFLFMHVQCDKDALDPDLSIENELMKSSNAKSSDGESAGNNLSYPVIWSDGASLALRGARWDPPTKNGVYYLVWGEDPIDPQATLNSCLPNANGDACEDGSTPWGTDLYWRSYVQKDPLNEWQAFNYNGALDGLWVIDSLDWGDNLESVDWTIRSQVRTEVVLYEGIAFDDVVFPPEQSPFQNQYAMRHAFGWGITEVHGLQTTSDDVLVPLTEDNPATVYTPNARLTIQKINVESRDEIPADNSGLTWDPQVNGWVGGDLFNPPLFNEAVWEKDSDGPGGYSAEVNVKGKVIFGYTWNVRDMNQDIGYYRITFSFDDFNTATSLNTEINETTTIMLPPVEGDVTTSAEDEGGDTGGAIAKVDGLNKLTYIDVLIRKNRGAGGGNGGGKDGNSGGGNGGGGKKGNH